MKTTTQTQARRILAAAQAHAGVTQETFAWETLLTHRRTLARWLAGDSPIPAPVRDWCGRWASRHQGAK